MNGFFTPAMSQRKTLPLVPHCGACGLFKKCTTPKIQPIGEGGKKILIVSDFPSMVEDNKGKPFSGETGQFLEHILASFDVDMMQDCWLTHSVICSPIKKTLPKHTLDYCRPTLIRTLKELRPRIVLLLGKNPVESLIPHLWGKESVGALARWVGYHIPDQKLNAWVCPVWHPSYILTTGYGVSQRDNEVRQLLYRKQLKDAVSLRKRPWMDGIPDYSNGIKILFDENIAVKYIASFMGENPVAFDYETDRLKPDSPDSKIVCCALSNGKRTIAFPWMGKAITAMKEFLASDTPKIAANAKFEFRWSKRHLKLTVKNLLIDTMVAAHVLDNRQGVTGLKFQAYVQLGQPEYNSHVEPFFESSGSNEPNRIYEVDREKLLLYCGLDARLEWELAQIQMRKLGML